MVHLTNALLLVIIGHFEVTSFMLPTRKLDFRQSPSRLSMVQSEVPLEIVGRDLEITPALSQRIYDKVGKVLSKLARDAIGCHVRLRIHRNPETEVHNSITKKDSQISEVTVSFKGGSTVRVSEHTDNMYASIDLMSHRLALKLKKHNEKLHQKNPPAFPKQLSDTPVPEFDEESLLLELDKKYKNTAVSPDPFSVDMSVVKPKSFPMPPISVEEAVLCLYYIDHPFYVFRNKDTNEINVVYKRNSGGVGHIKPEV